MLLQNIISIAYSVFAVPFLVSHFGKEKYGLIGIAISVNVYTQILEMGLTFANVKLFSEYIQNRDFDKLQRFLGLSNFLYIMIGLINAIIILLIAVYSNTFFNVTDEQADTLSHLLMVLSANAVFAWISVSFDQFLKAEEQIDWIAKRQSVLKLFQFLILASIIYFKLSVEFYFFCYTFLATIILPLSILKVRKLEPEIHLKPSFDKEMLSAILPYFLSFFSFGVFQFIAGSSRSILLGNISGPSSVAEFTVMTTVTSVVTMFTSIFTQTLLPIVSKMQISGNHNGLMLIVDQGSKYANILITAMVFGIIVSCKELISFYVGSSFDGIFWWLDLWLLMLLLSHRNVMTSLVFSQQNLRPVAIMSGIAMLCSIFAYILLIPKFGVGGAVIGYFIHELIHTSFYYFYYFPRIVMINTFTMFKKNILPIWIIAFLISLFVYFICNYLLQNRSDLIYICVKSSLFIVAYAFIIWTITLNRSDKQYIISMIKRK